MKSLLNTPAVFALVLALGGSAAAQISFGVRVDSHGRKVHTGVSAGVGHGGVGIGLGIGAGGGVPHHHSHSHACQRWVDAHYQVRREQVWVAGVTRQIWVEPRYRTEHTSCGQYIQVLVAPGHYQHVTEPGHYEWVDRQVYVQGAWITTCGH